MTEAEFGRQVGTPQVQTLSPEPGRPGSTDRHATPIEGALRRIRPRRTGADRGHDLPPAREHPPGHTIARETSITLAHARWGRVTAPLMGTRVLGQGLEFVSWILLARRLGASGFGSLSVAFLVCRYAGLVADWGASVRGARDVASPLFAAQVAALVRQRAAVAIILTALVACGSALVHEAGLAPLSLTILARGMGRDWIALGRGRGIASGSPAAVQGFVAFGLILTVHTTTAAALAIGTAYIAGGLISLRLNPLAGLSAAADGPVLRPHAWVLLAVLADQVSATMDTILLATLRSTAVAGVYAAMYRLPNAWTTVLGLMTAALVPLATRAAADDAGHFGEMTYRCRRLAMGGAAALLAAAPLAILLVPLIFGSAYAGGRAPLAILLVATAATTMSAPLQPLYLALGRDRELAIISCAGAAASLLGYMVLIPLLGPSGAALGTLLGQGAMLLLLQRRLRTLLPVMTT